MSLRPDPGVNDTGRAKGDQGDEKWGVEVSQQPKSVVLMGVK